jgi:site-specific DNA-methyltransferase (adenine-specific)
METNVILEGDCLSRLKELPNNSVDAVICDPPYGLEFMGKEWDRLWDKRKDTEDAKLKGTGNIRNAPNYKAEIQAQEFHNQWAKECLRVLKPGGHLLAFGGSRTYHRLACGIEDAGFEIRDQIMWIYGSGFPKSMNIGKAIDKMQGNEREVIGERKAHDIRGNALMEATVPEFKKENNTFNYQFTKGNTEWEGWGTGLKPAHEPIVIARKPISEKNVALNVLKYGTGGINIDESRIPSGTEHMRGNVGCKVTESDWKNNSGLGKEFIATDSPLGRFPANIIMECTCDILRIGKIEGVAGHFPKNCNMEGHTLYEGGFKDFTQEEKYTEKECAIHTNPDCPCFKIDLQSGISNSNGGQSYSKKSEIYGEYSNDRIIEGCGFGDKGGASRYFKNIHEEGCPCRLLDEQAPTTGAFAPVKQDKRLNNVYGEYDYFGDDGKSFRGDLGGASRFFYCAKASKSERNYGCEQLIEKPRADINKIMGESGNFKTGSGNDRTTKFSNFHPTVKPIKLMEYLVKLVTKEGAIVLDPFLGSGTTAVACIKLNRNWIGIEKNKEYIEIANARIKPYLNQTKLPNLSVQEVVTNG